jgi:S-adenosylmethionine hydrolase
MRPLITLTTDFGTGSPYVAQMKGVIWTICRDAELVDVTHAVGSQNIREGAIVLADVAPRFPAGTIHVAVVDPGVGTARRLIYAEIGSQRYLAPDNGLLGIVALRQLPQRLIALENQQFWLPQPSHTFHGRDILAPVAAHLASGIDPGELGPPLDQIKMLAWQRPVKDGQRITGEVLYVDSFGNLITNIGPDEVAALGEASRLAIDCGARQILGIVRNYGSAPPGELLALFDSQGGLEIAVANGSAARLLPVRQGETVTVSSVSDLPNSGANTRK